MAGHERERVYGLSWMWALWLSLAMGIHTTRRLSPCCVKWRVPCAHSLESAYRWSWLAHLRAGRCCYIDRCLGAQVSLGCEKTLLVSTSSVLPPGGHARSTWPPWKSGLRRLVVCVHHQGRLVSGQHTFSMHLKQRRIASCAYGNPMRLSVITAASVCVPIDARNRHTILHSLCSS